MATKRMAELESWLDGLAPEEWDRLRRKFRAHTMQGPIEHDVFTRELMPPSAAPVYSKARAAELERHAAACAVLAGALAAWQDVTLQLAAARGKGAYDIVSGSRSRTADQTAEIRRLDELEEDARAAYDAAAAAEVDARRDRRQHRRGLVGRFVGRPA